MTAALASHAPLVPSDPDPASAPVPTRRSNGPQDSPVPESLLPPELLARELLSHAELCNGVPVHGSSDSAGNGVGRAKYLSANADVWHFGQFLFMALYGEAAASS